MSTLEITCPSCERTIKAKPQHVGRRVNCPGCSKPFTVEDPQAENDFALAPLFDEETNHSTGAQPRVGFDATPPTPEYQSYAAPPAPKQQTLADLLPPQRSYPILKFVRIALFVFAAMLVASGVFYTGSALIGVFVTESVDPPKPELPADLPEEYASDLESMTLDATKGFAWMALFATLIYFAGTLAAATVLVAIAELIRVAIDVQENTLATAKGST